MSSPPQPTTVELERWLADRGIAARVQALPGDVSPRCYYRVRREDGGSAILAWYPEEMADRFQVYLETTVLLERIGVRVPALLERWDERRLMLLEDGGDQALADLPAGTARVERLYRRALGYARRIATLDPACMPASNAPLDEPFLRRELDATWRVFLERELAEVPTTRRELAAALDTLCVELGRRPSAPCHRDLMARNLLVRSATDLEDELLLIDHQDLRLGPPHYDLASLLHDSTRLSPDQIATLENELLTPGERETYARVACQRLFKIVGTFHSFAARGHSRHLARVPDALRAAARQLAALPEGASVAPRLSARWQERGR